MRWPRRNWAVVEFAAGHVVTVENHWTYRGALRAVKRYRQAVAERRQPGWPRIDYEVSRRDH